MLALVYTDPPVVIVTRIVVLGTVVIEVGTIDDSMFGALVAAGAMVDDDEDPRVGEELGTVGVLATLLLLLLLLLLLVLVLLWVVGIEEDDDEVVVGGDVVMVVPPVVGVVSDVLVSGPLNRFPICLF